MVGESKVKPLRPYMGIWMNVFTSNMLKSHQHSYKLGRTSACSSSRGNNWLYSHSYGLGHHSWKACFEIGGARHKAAYCVSLLNSHWLMVCCCCFCPASLLIKPCDKFLTGLPWIGLWKTFKTQPLREHNCEHCIPPDPNHVCILKTIGDKRK